MKTPQQIKNEVEKGCGKIFYKPTQVKWGDEVWEEREYTAYCNVDNEGLCPECKAKLSILTEYDKSIKEIIENMIKKGQCPDCSQEVKFCKCDFTNLYVTLKRELLSKIGDNSEVGK